MENTILVKLIKQGYNFLENENSLCNLRWRLMPNEEDEPTQTVVMMWGILSADKKVSVLRCLEKLQNDMKLGLGGGCSRYYFVENATTPFDTRPTFSQKHFTIKCSESLWEYGELDSMRAKFGPAEFENYIAFLLEYIFKFDAKEKIKYLEKLQKTKKVLVRKTITTRMVEKEMMKNFLKLQKTLKFVPLAKEFIKERL